MLKQLKLSLTILIAFISYNASSQQTVIKKYIIITYEDTYKHTVEGKQSYYWIIPQDSITSYNFHLSIVRKALLINDLQDCCNGKPVNPYMMRSDSKIDSDNFRSKSIEYLSNIIEKKRQKVLTMQQVWPSLQKEWVRVFATAVIGRFCHSKFETYGLKHYHYSGEVYFPLSDFSVDTSFWNSPKAKYIRAYNFLKVDYKSLPK